MATLSELQNEIMKLVDAVDELYERVETALGAEFEDDCDCDDLEPVYEFEGVDLHDLAAFLRDIGLNPSRRYSEGEILEIRARLEGISA